MIDTTIQKLTNDDKTIILVKDGQPLSCPFQPAIPIQGKLAGQISFIKQPCSSNCPFFDDYEELNRVSLNCKDVTINYKTVEQHQESKIKLL
jgi:hypothetical protein